jgi:hypothetical protein
VETPDELTKQQRKLSKRIVRLLNISMSYSNSPIVKQRNHCIFPLSNRQFHFCIGEIQVLLDGPTGKPKEVSCCTISRQVGSVFMWLAMKLELVPYS